MPNKLCLNGPKNRQTFWKSSTMSWTKLTDNNRGTLFEYTGQSFVIILVNYPKGNEIIQPAESLHWLRDSSYNHYSDKPSEVTLTTSSRSNPSEGGRERKRVDSRNLDSWD
eukprot:m.162878 g.162878  ORF g.162878 m.162878 type:complete len:111 (-) comp15208_c0_seq2:6418-6750(-)